MASTITLTALAERAQQFIDERDWRQFHDPKSLILALTGEVGELAELFQWVSVDGAEVSRQRAGEEMADVLIYLLHLANRLDIDLGDAVTAKMAANDTRFDAESFTGTAPAKK